jgi:hypothetical protein
MRKIDIVLILFILLAPKLFGQPKLDDFGRIALSTFLPENIAIPSEAKSLLENKINQIVTNGGMGSSVINPRFIITATINVGTKDIIPGPPQMIAQNIELTLFIGDAIENIVFSNVSVPLKGVGNNENKAMIDAFKKINPKNSAIVSFLDEAKQKIITYYRTQCDFILRNSQVLVKKEQFDEAIYNLSLVPEICQDCFVKCLDTLEIIYQKKIDTECRYKLNEAKNIWAAGLNSQAAEKVGEILSTVSPFAQCQNEISLFLGNIEEKLIADEKAKWQFKMKQYADQVAREKEEMRIKEDQAKRNYELNRQAQTQNYELNKQSITTNAEIKKQEITTNAEIRKEEMKHEEIRDTRNYELDKMRISSYREVAVEYARHQPKRIYNNIFWH